MPKRHPRALSLGDDAVLAKAAGHLFLVYVFAAAVEDGLWLGRAARARRLSLYRTLRLVLFHPREETPR